MIRDSPDDYLDEDPVIPSQRWALISILTPNSVNVDPENPINWDVRGFKIRGTYETREDAERRKTYLNKIDPYHHIFLGPIGRWLPWDDSVDNAEEAVHAEPKLNDLMKRYKEQEDKVAEHDEERKNIARQNAIKTRNAIEKQKKRDAKKAKKVQEPSINDIINQELVSENIIATQELSKEELQNKIAQLKKERENFVPKTNSEKNIVITDNAVNNIVDNIIKTNINDTNNTNTSNTNTSNTDANNDIDNAKEKVNATNKEINDAQSTIDKIEEEFRKAQEQLKHLS